MNFACACESLENDVNGAEAQRSSRSVTDTNAQTPYVRASALSVLRCSSPVYLSDCSSA